MKSTLIILCALAAFQPAYAQMTKASKPVKPKPAVKAPAIRAATPERAWLGHTVAISPSERHVIRAYVHDRVESSKGGRFNGVPQGLAKKVAPRGGLPAEWQKNCVRGQVLPEEVHKHCQPLPFDVVVKLPPPPPGTVLLAVDGTVLRVGYPTYEILDVYKVL